MGGKNTYLHVSQPITVVLGVLTLDAAIVSLQNSVGGEHRCHNYTVTALSHTSSMAVKL